MTKKITAQQIESILQAFYQTNVSAKDFDQIKKFLSELPEVEVPKEKK
jgi:hypothetical protein